MLFFQDMTSFHKAQAAKYNCSAGKWKRQRSGPTLFLVYDMILCSHNQLITSKIKKVNKNASKRLMKTIGLYKNQLGLRVSGLFIYWFNIITCFFSSPHLLLYSSGTTMSPQTKRTHFFVIIQIKHGLLRENVCQSTMRQS